MAEYVSKYTGAEIDEAVGKALNGGAGGAGAVSPTASVTQTESGATITITDETGTTTATVNHGKDGKDGQDGYTPVKGVDYFDGKDGKDGADGKDGKDGADGKDGKDAALYLTETEFSALTAEEITDCYNGGIRMVFVEDDHENLVPKAIGENGAVYYGCGYMTGYRLNSSGGVTAADCAVVTGYIPYTQGAKIRIVGGCNTASQGGCYLAAYDANFNLLVIGYLDAVISNSGGASVCTEDNVYIYTINTATLSSSSYINAFKNAAYIRVSLVPCVGHTLSIHYE